MKPRNGGLVGLYVVLLGANLFLLVSSLLDGDYEWWELALRLLVIPIWVLALRTELRKPKPQPADS
ncbi:hypothetical protein BJY16_005675 [Actinoplanes octamycinicus]|uniref:Uncharacterized protein n=1 Tax=Actinoplanes octamycinicus TaxID=135948 RepID=A0A7W7M9T8_9ACTN|nr:hypothetical protein [Actinoplanes octamycinicus]MBB4742216.1 hypothetical protein [Actinoplanes octamycinicus]